MIKPIKIRLVYTMSQYGDIDRLEDAQLHKRPILLGGDILDCKGTTETYKITELRNNGWELEKDRRVNIFFITNSSDHPLKLDILFGFIYDLLKTFQDEKDLEVLCFKGVLKMFEPRPINEAPSIERILKAYETILKSGFPEKVRVADFLKGDYGFETDQGRQKLFFSMNFNSIE